MPVARTQDLMNELKSIAEEIAGLQERSFSVFSVEELAAVAQHAGFPICAIAWEGNEPVERPSVEARPGQRQPTGVGLVKASFSVVVGVEYQWNTEASLDDTKQDATNLLDDLRGRILGFKGANSRPWVMVKEGPAGVMMEGVIFYVQLWETTLVISGNQA